MSVRNWHAIHHHATLGHVVMSSAMQRGTVRNGDVWHVMNLAYGMIAAGAYAHWKATSS